MTGYVGAMAIALAVITGLWMLNDLTKSNALLESELLATQREIAVQETIATQSRVAAEIAKAHITRLEVEAAEYRAVEEWINAQNDETPMPDLLRAVFDRLFGSTQDRNSVGRPRRSE